LYQRIAAPHWTKGSLQLTAASHMRLLMNGGGFYLSEAPLAPSAR
jgi:hypothetical protein